MKDDTLGEGSYGDEQPFTEDDYMDALRKASKPLPKQPAPDQLDDEDTESEDEITQK